MGREIKRVALDFDWPTDKVWQGYLNPHFEKKQSCSACDGTGSSPECRILTDQWYGRKPFMPEQRGSEPHSIDHPIIRARAEGNVERSPEYYGKGEYAILQEAHRLANLFNGQWMHHLNDDDVSSLLKAGRLIDLTHTWTPKDKWQPKDPPYIPTAQEVNDWSMQGIGQDRKSTRRTPVTE